MNLNDIQVVGELGRERGGRGEIARIRAHMYYISVTNLYMYIHNTLLLSLLSLPVFFRCLFYFYR